MVNGHNIDDSDIDGTAFMPSLTVATTTDTTNATDAIMRSMRHIALLERLTEALEGNPISARPNPHAKTPEEEFRLTMAEWRGASVQAIKNLTDGVLELRNTVNRNHDDVWNRFKDHCDRDDRRLLTIETTCNSRREKYDETINALRDKIHQIDVRVAGISATIAVAIAFGPRVVGAIAGIIL